MPLKVNIKRKDPRFKGDKPRYNVVVSGPAETFTSALRRSLEMQGLSPFKDDGGLAIWSSMPQIGGAPYYLAHLLASKYGAEIHRDCRREAIDVVGKREDADGLDRILGMAGAVPAGRQPLGVICSSTDFVANCDEEDTQRREFLEAAGWLPLRKVTDKLAEKVGTHPYRTRDPFIASNLEPFMSASAKKLMRGKVKEARRNITASKSHTAGEDALEVPAPEGKAFFPFQQGGISMTARSPGGMLIADDMGLGKTMQGIGVINVTPEARRILVICQANMRIKWGREIEAWKVDPDLTVGIAESSTFPETDICVINYDILQKNLEAMRDVEWDLIICDEAHNMKNPEAQRTQAVLGDMLDLDGEKPLPMSRNGKIVHLTGTPKPNRIEELWPLISSSRPDLWGKGPEDRQIFINRYAPPILIRKKMKSRYGKGERETIIPMPGKAVRETELQFRLRGSGSFIRRMKRDNPDLPPKFRTPLELPVNLSRSEKEALRSAEVDLEQMMERYGDVDVRQGESTLAGAVINQITRLNPDTPEFHEMARVRRNLGMLKAPHCARFILDELDAEKDFAEENRTKTVVFAHHKDVINVIKSEADKRMPGAFLVYDGSIGSAKRKQEIVDRFESDPDIRGLIISLSGNSGITLVQSARMRVVEPDWSPSNMIQIEDRIWRIGQEKNVDIGYMSMAGTLDARIGMTISEKMETDERSINTIRFQHSTPSQMARSRLDGDKGAREGDSESDLREKRDPIQQQEAQATLPLFD